MAPLNKYSLMLYHVVQSNQTRGDLCVRRHSWVLNRLDNQLKINIDCYECPDVPDHIQGPTSFLHHNLVEV